MRNIIDYAQGLKPYSFDQVFFKDLDVLALTEVAYLPFEQIVTDDEITIESIMLAYKSHFGHLGRIIYVYATNRPILRENRLQQLFDERLTNPKGTEKISGANGCCGV